MFIKKIIVILELDISKMINIFNSRIKFIYRKQNLTQDRR